MTPTDAQLAPIRETISATVGSSEASCHIERDKTHADLEGLLVGAVLAMAQAGVITINKESVRQDAM